MHRAVLAGLALCLFVLLAAADAPAQQINGQVRYASNSQPVENAPVRCDGVGATFLQLTDRSGRFVCRLGSPGDYTVTVRMPGYLEEAQSFHLADSSTVEFVFIRLRPDPKNPPEAAAAETIDASVPAEAVREYQRGGAALARGGKGGLEEAVRHLEQAISIHPNFTQAHLKLGAAYMDLQDWEKAERELRRTLEVDPKAVNAHFALGEMFLRQKNYDAAERSLHEGLKVEQRSWQGHLTLARVYWLKASAAADDAQARPSLELSYREANEALKLRPELAEAHLLKGNLLMRARRAPDALKEFKEYLRLEPRGEHAAATKALVEKIEKALAAAPKN